MTCRERCSTRRRLDGPGAEHPGELSDAVPDQLPQRPLAIGGPVAQRRDTTVLLVPPPDAGELRQLLLQRHPAEQVGHAFAGLPRRIPPDLRCAAGSSARR